MMLISNFKYIVSLAHPSARSPPFGFTSWHYAHSTSIAPTPNPTEVLSPRITSHNQYWVVVYGLGELWSDSVSKAHHGVDISLVSRWIVIVKGQCDYYCENDDDDDADDDAMSTSLSTHNETTMHGLDSNIWTVTTFAYRKFWLLAYATDNRVKNLFRREMLSSSSLVVVITMDVTKEISGMYKSCNTVTGCERHGYSSTPFFGDYFSRCQWIEWSCRRSTCSRRATVIQSWISMIYLYCRQQNKSTKSCNF
jgi:hypothetical protein